MTSLQWIQAGRRPAEHSVCGQHRRQRQHADIRRCCQRVFWRNGRSPAAPTVPALRRPTEKRKRPGPPPDEAPRTSRSARGRAPTVRRWPGAALLGHASALGPAPTCRGAAAGSARLAARAPRRPAAACGAGRPARCAPWRRPPRPPRRAPAAASAARPPSWRHDQPACGTLWGAQAGAIALSGGFRTPALTWSKGTSARRPHLRPSSRSASPACPRPSGAPSAS